MAKLSEQEMKEFLAPLLAIGEDMMDVINPSVWQVPEGYILEKFQVKGISVEHLVPREKTTDTVIYHLHGGAYAIRYMDMYRELSLKYSKVAEGAEVFSIDYGCVPNHVFPSALNESVAFYEWMLEQGYDSDNIVILGDSAGGNLTLVTAMYLRDHHMPMPRALVLFSPWTSLDPSFPSIESNKEKDLIIGEACPFAYNIVLNPTYAGDDDLKTPYLSPVYGDFHNLPPMLMQCGDHEVFLDEIVATANKAKEAGVDMTFHAYPGMSHDFQLVMPMLDETEEAWREIKEFFEKIRMKV